MCAGENLLARSTNESVKEFRETTHKLAKWISSFERLVLGSLIARVHTLPSCHSNLIQMEEERLDGLDTVPPALSVGPCLDKR